MADFKLGRIKFKWRGNWAASTAYLIDDVIKYGGNTYVCTTNHTSPSTSIYDGYPDSSTNLAYWDLQSEALFFKGVFSGSSVFYKLNDLVSYGQRKYRCTVAHVTSSSVLDTSNWELYQDGYDFKGNYAVVTYYKVNDIVKYGANLWICTTAHTSSGSTGQFDESKFSLYTEGLQFEDSWSTSTVYQKGDVVTYGGYSYVGKIEHSGQTPNTTGADTYWELLNPGFKALGTYSHGTAYKTGDVIKYGGNSYVTIVNNTSQYPSNTNGTVNTTYWQIVGTGFNYRAAYNSSTTYQIGDVVRLTSSTYLAIQDRVVNVSPDADAAKWQLIAQGDTGAVLSTRGDLIKQGSSASERLAIGVPGSVLTTNGSDPVWGNAEGKNVYYVANSGSDSNAGSQYLPFKTLYHALSQSGSGDVVDFDSITGGTGGTPGTYDVTQASTTGSGTGCQIRVVTDGSSTPTVVVISGGAGHVAGNVITFSGGAIGSSSNLTIAVVSASVGDVIYVKNGVYRETLPLRVPAGVTVQGESLRGTEIRPGSGTGHQVKTVTVSTGGTGGTPGTYKYIHANSTISADGSTVSNGVASSFVCNVVTDGSSAPTVTVYHGGTGFIVTDKITIAGSQIGGAADLVLAVASLENNDASNMFLVNNLTNITQMSMKGLTGTPGAGATGKSAVVSLDPSGAVATASPYIQNCTSTNANATGIQIDGLLHSTGNKSILCNDFTQINSDGKGVHTIGGGRGEMVSVFTYYNAISFHAESGGFIRGLNCSSGYGEQGAVADGTLASETPVAVAARGEMLKYATTGFVGGATESDVADTISTSGTPTAATIVGVTSGATATLIRVNISLDYLHITGRSGNFTQGEVCTITKDNSTTFQLTLDAGHGDSTAAQTGQIGPLIAVDGSALSSASAIEIGANVVFAGDAAKYYRVSAVSETNTSAETALIRLTESVTTGRAIADNEVGSVRKNFSNVRLTGHDFLDIGTGDIATSNYPGGPSQPADQSDEVTESAGGRVYFSSTDQRGDFRIGDLFKIEQSTGIATLNADAFDLSGLNELQLGSIGAELGATINEFSTDESLSNDSNTAIPTERAVVGYTQRDRMGTGHLVPPTGTTGERPTGDNLKTGGIRYNSSLVTWEGYNGTQWTGLGGGNPWASTSSDITVAANDRYFVDTSGGAKTLTLPGSPQVGDQVSFVDLAATFDTNSCTIGAGGNKIMGLSENLILDTENQGIQLVYTGSTYGWKLTTNL